MAAGVWEIAPAARTISGVGGSSRREDSSTGRAKSTTRHPHATSEVGEAEAAAAAGVAGEVEAPEVDAGEGRERRAKCSRAQEGQQGHRHVRQCQRGPVWRQCGQRSSGAARRWARRRGRMTERGHPSRYREGERRKRVVAALPYLSKRAASSVDACLAAYRRRGFTPVPVASPAFPPKLSHRTLGALASPVSRPSLSYFRSCPPNWLRPLLSSHLRPCARSKQ